MKGFRYIYMYTYRWGLGYTWMSKTVRSSSACSFGSMFLVQRSGFRDQGLGFQGTPVSVVQSRPFCLGSLISRRERQEGQKSRGGNDVWMPVPVDSRSGRVHLEGFQIYMPEPGARCWPWTCKMSRVRSTADLIQGFNLKACE